MNASKKQESRRLTAGISLIEVLVIVATISTLATIAYTIIASVAPASNEAKLSRQVAVLNASSAMYRLNGGYIDPEATTVEVFSKLQMAGKLEESDNVVGLSGSMIDPDLQIVLTSGDEINDPSLPRVVWNPAALKFTLTNDSTEGIKEFYLDSKGAATRQVATESRLKGGAVTYDSNGGWVWGYNETSFARDLPTYIAGGPPTTGSPTTPPPPASNVLVPPLISTPEGIYPITDYELSVTLANPNPTESSDIYYSINHGPSKRYKGEVLTLGPEEFVAAMSEPKNENWKPSIYRVAYYKASPVKLAPPLIRATSPGFNFETDATVHVSLANPNDPRVSEMQYRIDGGSWEDYRNRSIRFRESDYPEGVIVEARALPTAEYYLASDTSSEHIDPALATTLLPPTIAFDAPAFSEEADKVEVTLTNPNPDRSSDIYYAITDPEAVRDESQPLKFEKYKKPFECRRKDHELGLAIVAYAKAASRAYRDSVNTEAEIGNIDAPLPPDPVDPAVLAGGHFDLDTSSFIAEFHNGTTDAHVHEYNIKYETTGADYFDLKGGKLHHIFDDVPADAKFKLVVINPALSPGGRLVINRDYDDDAPSTWLPVMKYASIPLEDLPVFSLSGLPGTTKLDKLGLYFDVNAIVDGLIVPTNTGDVRSNVPGKYGEWRNGALTIQAVRVNPDGTDAFTTSLDVTSGGVHGGATSGLFWESTLFWHWGGPSYHEPENTHEPLLFTGLADGKFYNPSGEQNLVSNLTDGSRSNYFEWGTPTSGFERGSNITFTGASFEDVALGERFALGTMVFENSTINSSTDARHVEFELDLGLQVPDLSESLNFSFDLYSTQNRGSQTDDENADYFTFGNFSANFATEIEGQLYGLTLQFGTIDANGFSTISEFHTHEGKSAEGTLYGSFYAIDSADLADYFIP